MEGEYKWWQFATLTGFSPLDTWWNQCSPKATVFVSVSDDLSVPSLIFAMETKLFAMKNIYKGR